MAQTNFIITLRPGQNGRYFPDDILKWIFFNENIWILINISLKFVPMGPIIILWIIYWRIYVSLSLNELIQPMQQVMTDWMIEF